MNKPLPLERLLQSQGFGSRKAARALVQQARVAVNGVTACDPDARISPEGCVLTVDGADWPWRAQLYLALHKPAGVECSRSPQHHVSVLSLLPAHFIERGVQPVGRLDADTTGLLLLTDNGALNHTLASPRRHVPKTYVVTTKHAVDDALITALASGVLLHDETEPLAASDVRPLGSHTLEMTISQGKYHQVKRMVAAAGNRVEALHRIAMGAARLGEGVLADLPEGSWREIPEAQLRTWGWLGH
ncbi:pseudouridine synthase [Chitinimonas sp. BJYL2]|uniref:pseudouridine synthase n=1 Tax=Chitinimonas sp. BJYL2 TaxID=2976696 RepID=UPI0022B3EBC7|nr:16S rRNA pseudouridine(516) synthase [Chitinimonas sp. BJYL2]